MLTFCEIEAMKLWSEETEGDRRRLLDLEHRLRLRTKAVVYADPVCQELVQQIEHFTDQVNEKFETRMDEAVEADLHGS